MGRLMPGTPIGLQDRCMGSWAMKSRVANRIRNGTMRSKRAGASSAAGARRRVRPPGWGQSATGSAARPRAFPPVAPGAAHRPGQMATVLVALAVTDPRPANEGGKETSVPPPATELMAPARKAAPKATAACPKSSASTDFQLTIHRPIFPVRPCGFTV